jgi:D-alanyl-D-alanine carboxypeptidase (penicillin-binding protein 5/6)
MTLYVIFDKLRDGSLSLEETFTVSENAWRVGGTASGSSTMFLPVNSKVIVEDLIKGIIIQSGNDACIVAAENIAGSEENFAAVMNDKAKDLGLNNSYFANSTGLPHPDHKMSVEDLAKLAKILIHDFPEFYHLFSQKTFTYNNIVQGNRNPLLYSMSGADGLKTGHTEEAGFGLVSSVKRGDRRLIGVMNGMKGNKERSEEAEKLMNWGFREFNNYNIFKQYHRIVSVPVYMGEEKNIDLIVNKDVVVTIARNKAKETKLTAIYKKPVKAPIAIGEKLGKIRIDIPGAEPKFVSLYADRSIGKRSFWGRIVSNIQYLLFGGE